MVILHRCDHFVALLVQFDAGVSYIVVFEFPHQSLKVKAVGGAVGVVVPAVTILLTVAGSIEDMEDLLG